MTNVCSQEKVTDRPSAIPLQGGQIIDDELNQLLVNPLPHGARLHAIIDACHSGSVMDMEFRCEFQGGQPVWTNEYSQQPRTWKARTTSLGAPYDLQHGRPRLMYQRSTLLTVSACQAAA